jgi:hypothetical protein
MASDPAHPQAYVYPVPPPLERAQRRAVVEAALSWCDTPYRNCGMVKGPKGAVDCSMLLVAAWTEAKVFKPFDPRPYPSDWMLHSTEERYLAWMRAIADETTTPQPGDTILYMFGRCFSHAAIIVDDAYVVHAFADNRKCIKTERNWVTLQRARIAGGEAVERPQLYFDMWSKLRGGA